MSAILAGISLLFCMIVLALIGLIARDKAARKCFDRLSFRLIVYSLLSNCTYCIGYIICVKVGPGFWCGMSTLGSCRTVDEANSLSCRSVVDPVLAWHHKLAHHLHRCQFTTCISALGRWSEAGKVVLDGYPGAQPCYYIAPSDLSQVWMGSRLASSTQIFSYERVLMAKQISKFAG